MKYLIVNADDFGWTKGINQGILYAHEHGIVSSTTVMMNGPYATEAIISSEKYPRLGFGVHLVLTDGKPLGVGYKTLTDENDYFKKSLLKLRDFDVQEVEKEWMMQIGAFYEMGLTPTHFDSHMHVHRYKELKPVIAAIQQKYKLPVRNLFQYRNKMAIVKAGFDKSFYNRNANTATLEKVIRDIRDNEVLELMCHPAYCDEALIQVSGYNQMPEKELELLCNPTLQDLLRTCGVSLINFNEVPMGAKLKWKVKDWLKQVIGR